MGISTFLSDFCGQFEDTSVKIGESDKFREVDTWDSLTAMAVLYMIEKEYGVAIPVEDFKILQTPQDIFDYIQKRTTS